jgi:lysine 2,3-aminomutase
MTKLSGYPEVITKHWRSLINWHNPNDPLRLQVGFNPQENIISPQEKADPTDDTCHQVAPNLIHRYPRKALYLVTKQCVANCRFCFRRVTRSHLAVTNSLVAVRAYLVAHPEINELIFSGGDPLTLAAGEWKKIIDTLGWLRQVKIWRVHTRLPVFAPELINSKFLSPFGSLFEQKKKMKMVLHLNHSAEINTALKKAVVRLQEQGWQILAQGVLLKNVNDRPETLANLWREEINLGIIPYYLHHLDRVLGTGHFWLPLAQGLVIYRQAKKLAGDLPIKPKYILDLGKNGKVEVRNLRLGR